MHAAQFRWPIPLFFALLSAWALFGCTVVVEDSGGCREGAARCDGRVPQSCSADGSWVGDEACEFACVDGACAGICAPGSAQCDGLVPQLCSEDGVWIDGATCNLACNNGRCTGVCDPGSTRCDGLVPQTCDEDGAWRDGEACVLACDAGACTDLCELGTVRCDGRVPQVCGEGGWHGGAPCQFACSGGQCTGVCEPGSARCDGPVPQSCNAAGEWLSGQACEFACTAGACTGSCVPGEHRCADGTTVETCDASGTWQHSACAQACSAQTGACSCDPGYEDDGVDCTPIDFCSAPNGGCSPRAVCLQDGITPTCICSGGSSGDGYSCHFPPTRVFDEGFDDISRLASSGWILANRSSPLGTTSWYQGRSDPTSRPFDAFDGAPTSYIVADFNNTQGTDATISSWLASPPVPFGSRASVSFYTRSSHDEEWYADRIEVRLCSELPCFLPDDMGLGVGSYTTLLGSVNPNLVPDGYPDTWTRFEFTNADGIPTSGQGRVAIRYYVTDAGLIGDNSNNIGIDRFVGAFAAPSFKVGGSVAGLTSGSVVLWLNGKDQLPVAANGSFRFPRSLDGGTTYSVRVYAQPVGHRCTVAAASGTMGAADVDDVRVTCVRN